MRPITDEFRFHARGLSELYQQRKHLSKLIMERENRLRELGTILEFTDNLEKTMEEEEKTA